MWYGERDEEGSATTGTGSRVSPRLTSLLFLLGESCTASPGRYTNSGRAASVPVTMQRQVPADLRVRHPSDSVHRQSVGHSCYATETGIRSATVQVVGSVHSCFLAPRSSPTLAVACSELLAGDHAIRAVHPSIGDRPTIFCILVGMDRPGSACSQLVLLVIMQFVLCSFCFWTLGDDFKVVSVFCAELGSSADACTASVYGAL